MLSNAVTDEYFKHANGGSRSNSNSNHSVPRYGSVTDESLAKKKVIPNGKQNSKPVVVAKSKKEHIFDEKANYDKMEKYNDLKHRN